MPLKGSVLGKEVGFKHLSRMEYNPTFRALLDEIEKWCRSKDGCLEDSIRKIVLPSDPLDIEKLTRGQSENDLWFRYRECRITGSVLQRFYNQLRKNPGNIKDLKRYISKTEKYHCCSNPEKLASKSDHALTYGQSHEPVTKRYISCLFPEKQFISPGLMCLSEGYFMFGSSIDYLERMGEDECGQLGRLGAFYEIKCPHSIRLGEEGLKERISKEAVKGLLVGKDKMTPSKSAMYAKHLFCQGCSLETKESRVHGEFSSLNRSKSATTLYTFDYEERRNFDGSSKIVCDLWETIDLSPGEMFINPLHSYTKQMLLEAAVVNEFNTTGYREAPSEEDTIKGYLCLMIGAKCPSSWKGKRVITKGNDYLSTIYKYSHLPKVLVVTSVYYNLRTIRQILDPVRDAYKRCIDEFILEKNGKPVDSIHEPSRGGDPANL